MLVILTNKQGNVCGLSVREYVGYLLGLQVGWVGFLLNPIYDDVNIEYLPSSNEAKGGKKKKKK